MRLQLAWTLALAALPAAAAAEEGSWIFAPARYTHSPLTGQRVVQYSPEAPAFLRYDDTYQESGYRHNTLSLCVGDSADHLHVLQTWGLGVGIRPYGEWEYPYRPGATPYGPWMTPYPAWQGPFGQGPWQQGFSPLAPQCQQQQFGGPCGGQGGPRGGGQWGQWNGGQWGGGQGGQWNGGQGGQWNGGQGGQWNGGQGGQWGGGQGGQGGPWGGGGQGGGQGGGFQPGGGQPTNTPPPPPPP
jgi:hypothetical protein